MIKKKALSREECKMLVYNKMRQKGLSYAQACKELEKEIRYLNKIKKKSKEQKA